MCGGGKKAPAPPPPPAPIPQNPDNTADRGTETKIDTNMRPPSTTSTSGLGSDQQSGTGTSSVLGG